MDEWSRNLISNKPELADSVGQQIHAIKNAFEECFVIGHEPLIDGLTLPDPGDRHVLAAAIKCSAQVIVTENHKDFPADVLDEHDLITLSADDMLANTFDLFPIDCARALRTVRKRYGNPPFTPSEFLLDLTRAGMPKLAAMARASIEYL